MESEFPSGVAIDLKERAGIGILSLHLCAPEKWDEFVQKLTRMWLGPVIVTNAQIRSIKAPTLIIAGDHDPYNQTVKFVELYHLLPDGELAIIPGCGHVVLDCKGPFTVGAVEDFLVKGKK